MERYFSSKNINELLLLSSQKPRRSLTSNHGYQDGRNLKVPLRSECLVLSLALSLFVLNGARKARFELSRCPNWKLSFSLFGRRLIFFIGWKLSRPLPLSSVFSKDCALLSRPTYNFINHDLSKSYADSLRRYPIF